jgi:multidrug efflux pump subunit AcrA (membrane-fusion protein)
MDVTERPRGVAAGGHSRSRPGRTRWIALVALGVLVAGGYAIYAARQPSGPAVTVAPGPAAPPGEDPGAASPRSVSVERVEARLLSEPVRVTGIIRSDQTITVSTTATGLIRAVYAREGDRVERGKLLVLLDETERRAQYDRAVAALRAAETRLSQATTQRGIRNAAAEADYRRAEDALRAAGSRAEQARQLAAIADTESGTRVASARAGAQAARERLNALREGSRKQERAAAEAAVQRARTQVERARTALVRRTQLLREGAIAPEVVDNARRDLEVASADLEAARQQLSLVEEGPRTEEIRVAEEALRQAEAAMQDAEANQARRRVSREEVESTVAEVRRAEAARDAARAALASTPALPWARPARMCATRRSSSGRPVSTAPRTASSPSARPR